jgi:hypothetical protein
MSQDDNSKSLSTLLRLTRGHWLELGIETAFDNLGVKFTRQMEISVTHEDVLIKAHLAFILPGAEKNLITVLEIKSSGKPRDYMYESHEA